MDCCKQKEVIPDKKEKAPESKGKVLIAAFLIILLLGGLIIFFR